LHTGWQDEITNIGVLEQRGISSLEAIVVETNQFRWPENVVRTVGHILTQVFYSQLSEGPKETKPIQDPLKASLKACDLNSDARECFVTTEPRCDPPLCSGKLCEDLRGSLGAETPAAIK